MAFGPINSRFSVKCDFKIQWTIARPQRRVICRWNENFVNFQVNHNQNIRCDKFTTQTLIFYLQYRSSKPSTFASHNVAGPSIFHVVRFAVKEPAVEDLPICWIKQKNHYPMRQENIRRPDTFKLHTLWSGGQHRGHGGRPPPPPIGRVWNKTRENSPAENTKNCPM